MAGERLVVEGLHLGHPALDVRGPVRPAGAPRRRRRRPRLAGTSTGSGSCAAAAAADPAAFLHQFRDVDGGRARRHGHGRLDRRQPWWCWRRRWRPCADARPTLVLLEPRTRPRGELEVAGSRPPPGAERRTGPRQRAAMAGRQPRRRRPHRDEGRGRGRASTPSRWWPLASSATLGPSVPRPGAGAGGGARRRPRRRCRWCRPRSVDDAGAVAGQRHRGLRWSAQDGGGRGDPADQGASWSTAAGAAVSVSSSPRLPGLAMARAAPATRTTPEAARRGSGGGGGGRHRGVCRAAGWSGRPDSNRHHRLGRTGLCP